MKRRLSQSDPYTSAIYLRELLRGIEYIADHPGLDTQSPALAGLLTIAHERAEQLAEDLDARG